MLSKTFRTSRRPTEHAPDANYWSRPASSLLSEMQTSIRGLSNDVAAQRLLQFGANRIEQQRHATALATFARQFRNPLVLILIFAAGVSALVGNGNEAVIIGLIVLASCVLSFTQEYSASRAMESLRRQIFTMAVVLRNDVEKSVPAQEIVPGDILRLSAGNLIPADSIILEGRDFNVSEAVLTGETFPVVKSAGLSAISATVSQRTNMVFMGTSVRSGTATVLVVSTGNQTEFAKIAKALERQIPETDFARGIRRFGTLMTEIMLTIVIVVFVSNLLLHRPLIDSLLFSLALAVGLTPELLPAIISITLSKGARRMAENGVIVRRLEAIENLGSMDILCTDKTGTLTEGVIHLDGCFGTDARPCDEVYRWAKLNATLQSGLKNPLDEAIAAAADNPGDRDMSTYSKIDETPYDFIRKRLTVVVRQSPGDPTDLMICKGAMSNVMSVCTSVMVADRPEILDDARKQSLDEAFKVWSAQGFRVLGLAIRQISRQPTYSRDDETQMSFAGFLLFLDPPKAGIKDALAHLASRGIGIKVITGDNRYVARHLAETIGLDCEQVLTGDELNRMTKSALFGKASKTNLFVEIDPNQKERIIAALRSHGHVVGYLGDGINDAPALHEADIGISVDGAVDVAREAADMILLKQDLGVLLRGIDDGRRTFANTMKYVSITTSANFGNMISMAIASLFLPFLPLLAKQILLNNLLSSIPSLAIASDNVDPGQIEAPHRWDIGSVRRFMFSFGLVSSAFDFLTFGFLLLVMHATPDIFRTAWFIESLITQLAIVLIVRTHFPFWKSRPGPLLSSMTLAIALLAVAIPYLPFADWFGFVPLPLSVMLGLVAITMMYLIVSEATKRWFFAREQHHGGHRGKVRTPIRRHR
ncbi:magnesium-translocating P-type ATPase [Rhizobium sp. Root1204]|uniref:magnesium-translocating P-type ATPase n=1 Tax=Rhizobium sp. Root1204 TaxID=1736428 RepID=UPI00071577E0|nr:magnesium-translocating P-type ATPase [Rhizobium sp. Root1204]KQV36676.1 magnesium-translocating P-type ATPase [Rhizobium sp. Root1204]